MKSLFLFLFSLGISHLLFAQDNLLEGKNPNCDGPNYYTYGSNTHYITTDSHTDDGSGCFVFTGTGGDFIYPKNYVETSSVTLKGKHKYVFRVYMKMPDTDYGQNIFFKVARTDGSNPVEMLWNVNTIGDWEEVLLPYRVVSGGDYKLTVFVWPKYMHTTDGNFGESDGSNLAACPQVLLDDFSVVEMNDEEIPSQETTTAKISFSSEYIRVDEEGNFEVREGGDWKPVFPRIAYQSWYGDFSTESARMAEYGFNGWANLESVTKFRQAVSNGMIYNGIQINNLDDYKSLIPEVRDEIANGGLPPASFLLYVIDNEMTDLCQYENKLPYGAWLDENDPDPVTNKRARPVLVFNGQAEGLARSYNNDKTDLMDIVGSYVSETGNESDFRYNPTSNISLLRNTHKQQAPAVFLDVQCYYHYSYVPAIFKGILNGAKGLKFWRGGTDYLGSQPDFRQNVWAPALKGPDGVFARIDSMLVPIIRQPLGTPWKAVIPVTDRDIIALGTRDNKELGKHYLILANFADTDTVITITFDGLKVQNVKDFFTKRDTGTLLGDTLRVNIGHYNEGYLVLEMEEDDMTATPPPKQPARLNIYPNPADEYVIVNSGDEQIEEIVLTDMAGRIVRIIPDIYQKRYRINTAGMVSGIYFVKTRTVHRAIFLNKIIIR